MWQLPSVSASDVLFYDGFSSRKLNLRNWGYDLGDGCDIGFCGWGNQERQVYTKESVKTDITTRDKFTFKYGRVDVRARLPIEDGAFPAIWMMPQNSTYGIWPKSGEIDITECQSLWRTCIWPARIRTPGSLHYAQRFGATTHSFWAEGNDPSRWHIYSLIWRPDSIEFQLDGRTYGKHQPTNVTDPDAWPFNQPFYLLINLAVEPGWGMKAPQSLKKMTMDVDWIRVTSLQP
ncbi:concanavalin A-like lectin/glucanase domain-containing protein [Thamnocephalis sphaerospora]|uniref:Concanavalin A-like lectin/glucanase domain-containing protein n=1 Tax=Thamnocephalis sphaerospora TaxID=78915 RepID=A0A4P9XKB9_9FUNG|nr:concanavalin A-like lectin/glucanase domain-containing protein [Thamnocephalis sphaerospora]|eukprot:RKP05851.1 concanavalin A-like lectin/glucanase domain-containing protein [Thamnocephalis sphaerospora]